METVVLFLLQAIASGTTGHYLQKALTKADSEVGKLFASGAPVKDIEEAIEKNQVAEQISDIFQDSIKSSIILSDNLEIAATPDDVIQIIEPFVSLGFQIARQENFDLVLPGSPLCAASVSIFEVGHNEQKVQIRDRSIEWNRFAAKLFIVPMEMSAREAYWQNYLNTVRRLRNDSKSSRLRVGHAIPKPEKLSDSFEVQSLTAGSVRYQSESPLMEGRSEQYDDWNNGILAMIDGIKQVKALKYVPSEDWEKWKSISAKGREALN